MENCFAMSGRNGFVPAAFPTLFNLDPSALSHSHYQVRHPADIFCQEFTQVSYLLIRLLNELDTRVLVPDTADELPLNEPALKTYADLLGSFWRYVECGYEIILSVCERQPMRQEERKFLFKWLERKGANIKNQGFTAGKVYYSIIRKSTDYFRQLHNQLKHTSDCLRAVTLIAEFQLRFGYFVETADPDGGLGPNARFHDARGDGRAANSFHRDLRLLYYAIVLVAEGIRRATLFALRDRGLPLPSAALIGSFDEEACRELYGKISTFPRVFFPSEAGETVLLPSHQLTGQLPVLRFRVIKVPHLRGPFRTTIGAIVPMDRRYRVPFP